uniref:Non-canonical non-ribosomal peptide synthetase FUB8 ) n=1 Tax=Ganoderma boninense TaxID=34458 RepID=A0A5K1JUE0_9APHY|nr:Non-canonical non-ribosomal peptide synthetase FUB8 (EC (Fusaric acid biosynthesis protein 8) [Ganoderma boninense]
MSDGSASPPVPEETILEIGPILVGALLSWMLLGISTVQLYFYHVSFPNDNRLIQTAVYVIYLLDIFQSIVAASEAWQFLVAGWGRQINIDFPGWTFTALPIVSSLGV